MRKPPPRGLKIVSVHLGTTTISIGLLRDYESTFDMLMSYSPSGSSSPIHETFDTLSTDFPIWKGKPFYCYIHEIMNKEKSFFATPDSGIGWHHDRQRWWISGPYEDFYIKHEDGIKIFYAWFKAFEIYVDIYLGEPFVSLDWYVKFKEELPKLASLYNSLVDQGSIAPNSITIFKPTKEDIEEVNKSRVENPFKDAAIYSFPEVVEKPKKGFFEFLRRG